MASADNVTPAPGALRAARAQTVPAPNAESRPFMIGLTCAALLHAMLIAAAIRSAPRVMGEKNGSLDGISVEVIDEADYRSRTTMPPREQPSPTPPAPRQETVPPAPPPQPPQPPDQAAAEPAPPPTPALVQKKAAAPSPDDSSLPGLFSLPQTLEQPSNNASKQPDAAEKHDGSGTAATPRKPPPKTKPELKPDLATPSKLPEYFVPLSAAVARPAGITRSGENDDFGRGVIRALRQTMPPHRGTNGRVSIRLILNENGNIANVQVMRNSGDPNIDQSVVFASKQSNFPLPPHGSTVADRTFLVTYIYN